MSSLAIVSEIWHLWVKHGQTIPLSASTQIFFAWNPPGLGWKNRGWGWVYHGVSSMFPHQSSFKNSFGVGLYPCRRKWSVSRDGSSININVGTFSWNHPEKRVSNLQTSWLIPRGSIFFSGLDFGWRSQHPSNLGVIPELFRSSASHPSHTQLPHPASASCQAFPALSQALMTQLNEILSDKKITGRRHSPKNQAPNWWYDQIDLYTQISGGYSTLW